MSGLSREVPLDGTELATVPGIGEGYVSPDGYVLTDDVEAAHVVTSRVAARPGFHKVVLDLDLPAKLVPSSTPGHFHLYIDHELSEGRYFHLLDALADAGLIERGYQGASEARGFTAVRLPWVRKHAQEAPQ